MKDRILLGGIRLATRIGVPSEERGREQEVIADLEMTFDTRAAAAGDDFTKTVDYAAVRDRMAEVARARPRALIETLAEDLTSALLSGFGVDEVRLRLRKPAALRHAGVDYAGVEIERRRDG